ncbi:formate--tetrahydrofolate ligase [Aequorivita lipolytica]|uniref:Formate--tetrahydrofolate ligase n=1 Tax=Aequorivita lipolytica TaxID=153267 RepID=A0A5C6YSB9_9FLAO|nr:formate--tetrahydrofolate ligase [Aequorivita lipolytica]TXD69925.1 formate--tetrahydrofolate ligase [Aequorivita lipolytica]SRX50252.1 Formate--tetrahydrofolate ligase [Aequorivita lipolytica]
MTDIQIAQSVTPEHIKKIAAELSIPEDKLEYYGNDKAKIPLNIIDEAKLKKSNLILVTAITPTPAGEGKTTTCIGLGDALNYLKKKAVVVIREPSLGPVFGIKGGAAGGGRSQVIPMVDINLHFTGDFHAIEKANNLLSALIENNIQSKSRSLGIDPRTVIWKRCMDMNDRGLRNIVAALGGKAGGIPRETGFNITAASEIMAILCMASNLEDLKERCGNIYIGDTWEGKAVYAKDLNANGAMAVLLKDAIKPNLVQTLEGNPAIIHGGPFANIAQGTNSIIATKMGMTLCDYTVTEAGFGADLGAEKFMNIKCRAAGISPKTIVLVATIRALKYHGGKSLKEITQEDVEAVRKGLPNLERHISSLKSFGIPIVVSLNAFKTDTEAEMQVVADHCEKVGIPIALSYGWEKGGKGCTDLAEEVIKAANSCSDKFHPTYSLDDSVNTKIEKICQTIYGAEHVELSNIAISQLRKYESMGYGNLPICMAKTEKSFSDDEKRLGRPEHFDIHIREFEIATGAGFIIPIAGNILRMPGLPATPAAEKITIDENGIIEGLF